MKNKYNLFVIMPVWMTELVMEIRNKMKNKHNIYVIMEEDDVIKGLWNKYVQKNPCQTEELTKHAGKVM